MRQVALTTVDNPFNPIDEFDQWLNVDIQFGYNTCGLLSRLCDAHFSITDSMTDEEKLVEIEKIIDNWIKLDPTNLYKKVVKN